MRVRFSPGHPVVALLRRVCDETGCHIVMSSTWRRDATFRVRFTEQTNQQWPFHEDWRTKSLDRPLTVGFGWIALPRGEEIQEWLDRHSEVAVYAIVDDDNDMKDWQLDRFVRTNFETGLTVGHAEALIEILKQ